VEGVAPTELEVGDAGPVLQTFRSYGAEIGRRRTGCIADFLVPKFPSALADGTVSLEIPAGL
jgi:hypothetical protein